MARRLIAFIVGTAAVHSLAAEAPKSRAAWELTDDERIRERSDPVKAKARVRQVDEFVGTRQGGRTATKVNGKAMRGDIVGRLHPELFLGEELFRFMIEGAFAEDVLRRTVYRENRAEDIARLGLPVDFWARVEPSVAEYISTLKRARALNRQAANSADTTVAARLSAEAQMIQQDQCARIAAALTLARTTFGRTAIDRFLYEAVAPSAVSNFSRPYTAAELHKMKGGCK